MTNSIENWPPRMRDFTNRKEFHVDFLKRQFSDFARPNLFKILINAPISGWNHDLTSVLAKSSKIPSIDIGSYDLELCGKTLHLPTNKVTYGDVPITFYSDEAFKLRLLFHKWQKAIYDWENNTGTSVSDALKGSLIMNQFNSVKSAVYGIELLKCWPKTVGEISIGQDLNNVVEEFTVNFLYTDVQIYKGK